MSTKHPQKEIKLWNGNVISVDVELADLIKNFNREGLITYASCQDSKGLAYLFFGGVLSDKFCHLVLDELLVRRDNVHLQIEGPDEKNSLFGIGVIFRWMSNGLWHYKIVSMIEAALKKLDK